MSGGGIKSRSDIEKLEAHLVSEGAVSNFRNGKYVLRLRDGVTTVSLHTSISDKNGWRPLRSQIKRAGHTWPGDRHQITKGERAVARSNKEVRAAVEQALKDLGDEIVRPGLLAEHLQMSGGNMSTIYSHLEALGYSPDPSMKPKARGRTWRKHWPTEEEQYPEIARAKKLMQDYIDNLPEQEPEPVIEPLPVRTEWPSLTEPVHTPRVHAKQEAPALDFIDERDSWTVNLEQVQHLTIDQLRMAYHAADLRFELRVWKQND